jgi:hypothetical protein
MPNPILLPNNNFGCAIFCLFLVLLAVVPFVVTFWLASLISPWWVAVPVAILVAAATFVKLVKFKK